MRAAASGLPASCPTARDAQDLAAISHSAGQAANSHFLKMPSTFIHSFIHSLTVHSGRPYSEQGLGSITPLLTPRAPP